VKFNIARRDPTSLLHARSPRYISCLKRGGERLHNRDGSIECAPECNVTIDRDCTLLWSICVIGYIGRDTIPAGGFPKIKPDEVALRCAIG
jgi:hypothetical protein